MPVFCLFMFWVFVFNEYGFHYLLICNWLTSCWVFLMVVLLIRFYLHGENAVVKNSHVLFESTVGEVHCEASREASSCHADIVRFMELEPSSLASELIQDVCKF